MQVLLPEGWAPPIGYANGIAVAPGRIVFIAGQVGWDAGQKFHSTEVAPQFDQALQNVLAVLAEAGAAPNTSAASPRSAATSRPTSPRARNSARSGSA